MLQTRARPYPAIDCYSAAHPDARLTVVAASYCRLRSPRCPSRTAATVDSAHPPGSRNHHPLLRYGCKERAAFSAVDEIANALPALEIESQNEK
ncbi:hypothetical protein R1flu_013999 [Riccia fluitans]|uniref:Uncharacterized protein n=1 Tax=Riccia fluitans TaxID=41844 RepID=A0ABD1YEV3_9MARC